MTKRIVFTGGGSAGHVIPNIELITHLKKENWHINYIGSRDGIEKTLMEKLNVPYYGISTGKLRRYFSWQNFIDPFRILKGIFSSYRLLSKLKPDVVFSKGGFVAFPVVVAAWLKRIKVVAHESDLTPGLANRLSFPFASRVCVTFEKAKQLFKKDNKVIVTGSPIREQLFKGDRAFAKKICQFMDDKPTIMFFAGGLGSVRLNQVIAESLDSLLKTFNVIHLYGKGKAPLADKPADGYKTFAYVDEEMSHLYALADVIVSRSGANSVLEIMSLCKPHIFIPLSLAASRGDQIHNARHFEKLGASVVLAEADLTVESLLRHIEQLYQNRDDYKKRISALNIGSGTNAILDVLKERAS